MTTDEYMYGEFKLPQSSSGWLSLWNPTNKLIQTETLKISENTFIKLQTFRYKEYIISNSICGPAGYGGIQTSESGTLNIDNVKKLDSILLERVSTNPKSIINIFSTPSFNENTIIEKNKALFLNSSTVQRRKHYQYVEIDKSIQFSNTNSKQRNSIKRMIGKARKMNLRTYWSNNAKIFNEWYNIYKNECEIRKSYSLPKNYLEDLLQVQEDDFNVRFLAITTSAKVIGGVIIIVGNNCAKYFISSINQMGKENGGGYLIVDEVINSLRLDGVKYINFQSSGHIYDGVYKFKESIGCKLDYTYHTTYVGNEISFNKLRHFMAESKTSDWNDYIINTDLITGSR